MAVSIQEVAERAGVSQATVSKVLNKTEIRFKQETSERVHNAARELGYRPNVVARRLARQRTETIGLMVSMLDNPFFLNVLQESESRIFRAGYHVLLDANCNDYANYQPLHQISGWLVDGVLMWSPSYSSLTRYLGAHAENIPVVYLGHLRDDGGDACAFDLYGAGRQVMGHLIERGYRRLCYVSDHPLEHVVGENNQVLAIRALCAENGLELEIAVVDPRDIAGSCFCLAQEIAARPRELRPDAVVCSNDHMALAVYPGLIRGGLRVPEDIALVGFDGIAQSKYLPHGPLTTVRMPVDTLCARALEILWRRIDSSGRDVEMPPQSVLIPTELVIGATT